MGCSKQKVSQSCGGPAEAAAAFRAAIAAQHPEWKDELKLRVALNDKGDHWRAWFQLPEGTLGGSAEGDIDKKTCEVSNISHTQ